MVVLIVGLCVGRALAADVEFPFQDYNLPVDERVEDLVSRLTLEEKALLMNADAAEIPRFGIKKYKYGSEALHGIMGPGNFTVFPQAIAIASTWDPALVEQVTTAISDEAWGAINRAVPENGYPGAWLLSFWSPNVNMARDPRWGRTPETYGEDPFLTGTIGVAFVKGLQGNDPKYIKTVASPKHFVANNEEHNRFRCNVNVKEKTLREYYLPAFKRTIMEGKAQSIMSAYNAINGMPCSANRWLLTDVLREEWGFNGYVVTDCSAPKQLIKQHKYANTEEESAAYVVNAGVDIECEGAKIIANNIISAKEQALVTEETIDNALRNIIRVRMKLGMFDPPEMNPYSKISPAVVSSKEHAELAKKVSLESIVLLKNGEMKGKKALPLEITDFESIAVVGPNAKVVTFGDYTGKPVRQPVTPLQGVLNRAGGALDVKSADWVDLPLEKDYSVLPSENLKTGDQAGLKVEFFSNRNFEGEPVEERIDSTVELSKANVPHNKAIKSGQFSARWTGKFVPMDSGFHIISITSKGDVKLYIDDELMLDYKDTKKGKKKAKVQAGQPMSSYLLDRQFFKRQITGWMFEAGKEYDIVLEYVPSKGQPVAKLEWVPPVGDAIEIRKHEMEVIKESDVVIAVMGYYRVHEHENIDRVTLQLPDGQMEYIKAMIALNPNTVVVLVNGSPVSIRWIEDNAPAIVELWYPGEQGGDAMAEVLFGDYNPGGKLPLTFYNSIDELPPFDDYEISRGRTYMYYDKEPIYPFGYGLSYTTFEYEGLELKGKSVGMDGNIDLSLTVKNTGDREGDEIVQLYFSDLESSVKQPIKRLKGFRRVHLEKGASEKVEFSVPVSELSFWDERTKKFIVEPGEFEVQVGASSRDIRLKEVIEVK